MQTVSFKFASHTNIVDFINLFDSLQVIWKQLMGANVLEVTLGGDESLAPNTTIHAWCGSSRYGIPKGSVVLAWVNANTSPVTLSTVRCV